MRKPPAIRRPLRGKDRLSAARRSWNISRIKGKNTTPEMRVRTLLHRLGYRFRLHVRIPVAFGTQERRKGKSKIPDFKIRTVGPDLLLVRHRVAVFVHDCFWHRHRGCTNCTTPTRRRYWWLAKLNGNAVRDQLQQRALRQLGWRSLVAWECETEKPEKLERLRNKLAKQLRRLGCGC